MNYKIHYAKLIRKARNRVLGGDVYVEKHHIKPRCLGGTNETKNLVTLLPTEHFVAHQLLVKMYPNHYGLLSAAHLMMHGYNLKYRCQLNSRQYAWLKNRFIQYGPRSDEFKEKCRIRSIGQKNNMYGKTHTDSAKKKIGDASKIRNQGDGNGNAKTWCIIDPNGTEYRVKGSLIEFARRNNLSPWTLAEIAKNPQYTPVRGNVVGWKCVVIGGV